MRSIRMLDHHVEPVERPRPERIEEIICNARRERAEAIAQLFGFGFTVPKEAISARRRNKAVEPKFAGCVYTSGPSS
jgi:hypothetical protein